MARENTRPNHRMRDVSFTPYFTRYAEGSVLAACGHTKVLCNTSVIEGVPKFLRDKQQGWLTAEYQMLPRSTHTRSDREQNRGKPNGRSTEIQRLIGRSLRNCIDLKKIPDFTLVVDCDVIQADGGTRTTALNGAIVSLVHALQHLQYKKKVHTDPLRHLLTAFSIGTIKNQVLLDLDYQEDSKADADCNIVLTEHGDIIEIQGTGEQQPIAFEQLHQMLQLANDQRPIMLEKMQEAIATPRP